MNGFYLRWLARSLKGNISETAISLLSLSLLAAVVYGLTAISLGVGSNIASQLGAYGANLLLAPAQRGVGYGLGNLQLGRAGDAAAFSGRALADLERNFGDKLEVIAPVLVAPIKVDSHDVVMHGYDMEALRRLNPLLSAQPSWPKRAGEAVLGGKAAALLGVEPGDRMNFSAGAVSATVEIAGITQAPGEMADQILVDLNWLRKQTGSGEAVSYALAAASLDNGDADGTAELINAAGGEIEARSIRQVAGAQYSLLERIKRLFGLTALIAVLASLLTAGGAALAQLMARRREFGLYFALGAEHRTVRRLLFGEALLLGLCGGALGSGVGMVFAGIVTRSVFGQEITVQPGALAPALLAAPAISLLAVLPAVRKALSSDPYDVLRQG